FVNGCVNAPQPPLRLLREMGPSPRDGACGRTCGSVVDDARGEEVGMETPTLRRLIIAKSRLSPSVWDSRVQKARKAEEVMKAIVDRQAKGASLNRAIGELLPRSRRSWALRHWWAYQRHGFEGLLDARLPREPKQMRACEGAVEVARLANPKVT